MAWIAGTKLVSASLAKRSETVFTTLALDSLTVNHAVMHRGFRDLTVMQGAAVRVPTVLRADRGSSPANA